MEINDTQLHISSSNIERVILEQKLQILSDKLSSNLVKNHEVSGNRRDNLIFSVQEIILNVLTSISNSETPNIILRNQKDWDNCTYKEIIELKQQAEALIFEIKYHPRRLNKEFTQVVFLLAKIYQLLSRDESSLRREIYYENLTLFDDQSQLDSVAEKISCLLGVPQWEVGLLTSSKGIVAGSLQIICDAGDFYCSSPGGIMIPCCNNGEVKLISSAKFVLIIEKDSAFKKIYDEGFLERHGPCIMITGRGYPDVITRVLLKSIWEQLSIPAFVLVDADPHGIEIMCIYKFGSLKQSHISDRLAVPSVQWLGVHPTDIEELNIPNIDLSMRDMRKLQCLLLRPYIKDNARLKNQLSLLSSIGKKSEIEGLLQISNGYITDVYIPTKISSKECI